MAADVNTQAATVQVTPQQLAPYIDVKLWVPAALWVRLEAHFREVRCASILCALTLLDFDAATAPLLGEDDIVAQHDGQLARAVTGAVKHESPAMPATIAGAATAQHDEAPLPREPIGLVEQEAELDVPSLPSTSNAAAQHSVPPLPRADEGVLEGLRRGSCWLLCTAAVTRCYTQVAYAQQCQRAQRRCEGKSIRLHVLWLVAEGFAEWGDVPDVIRRLQPHAVGEQQAA
eukprot:jgi/Ulvmu1/5948/UM026_0070.1